MHAAPYKESQGSENGHCEGMRRILSEPNQTLATLWKFKPNQRVKFGTRPSCTLKTGTSSHLQRGERDDNRATRLLERVVESGNQLTGVGRERCQDERDVE